ncbi:MAG: ribbon-helix-helix protein, CopG family, partial [Fervidicoccaceae archaeon]
MHFYTSFGIVCHGGAEALRVKTSIYVDKELWEKFKTYAMRRGREVSELLEEAIRDEMV